MDAATWNQRYADTDLVWSASPNIFVAESCGPLLPGVAADLGAGEGRHALWLAGLGWRVYAVDFADAGLDKGRRVAQESADITDRITWVCADATAWTPPEPLDLVLLAYLQLPASQRRGAVRSAYAGLAPGGLLVMVGHDSSNLADGVGGPQDPEVLFTAADVLADLAGTVPAPEVTRADRAGRAVGDAIAYDCVVVLRKPDQALSS